MILNFDLTLDLDLGFVISSFRHFSQDIIFAIPVIVNKQPYTGFLWNSKGCNACKFWWVCSMTGCVCRSHGLMNQDKLLKFGTYVARCILLEISSVFFCKKKPFFQNFGDYCCVLRIFHSFPGFFLHVLRYLTYMLIVRVSWTLFIFVMDVQFLALWRTKTLGSGS